MERVTSIILFLWSFLLVALPARSQDGTGMISGRVVSTEKEVVDFASVYLKGTTHGCVTNEKGLYHLKAPAGKYTLVVTAFGYRKLEQAVEIVAGGREKLTLVLRPQKTELDEVVVTGSGVSQVNKSAFNAVAIDAAKLHNSTQDLAAALGKVPGVKLRESGGVGSDMQFSLDGFTGKHVKVFIDGVPQEGVGSSFGLNNIPINFAERIEVYKGVVPVGFGTDALGGVVNIVTNKKRRTFVDASYSYGSFNTHKSYVNAGHTLSNGLTFEINAFQNYSDNSYYVDTPVKDFETGVWDTEKKERVKRFHDAYHNEAVMGKIGLVNRSFADRLMFTFVYSQNDNEVQTGVVQEVVYGQKRTKGHSYMPSLEYLKRNLFTKGLDVNFTVNYNKNFTHNIDTATYEYNWRGESRYMAGKLGEQTYQDSEFESDNWNGTFTANYRLGEAHAFVLNNVTTGFTRTNRSTADPTATGATAAGLFDKKSRKNVTGLSYRFSHKEQWNVSVFGKYYNQFNSGPRNLSTSGYEYVEASTHVDAFGYGAAATYFFLKGFQAKLSYEKALRLPTTDELFGDEDLEMGAVDLKPEKSHNLNIGLSYARTFKAHAVYAGGGFVFRRTSDYIRRTIGSYSGGLSYASHENHGLVRTVGFNAEMRYDYSHWLSLGGNLTSLDIRDYERYVSSNSRQESTTYKVRMPNTPYFYTNADISFHVRNLFGKGNRLTLTYDNYYVKGFPLHWENHGSASTKKRVPNQFSHNASLTYSLKNGRYNFALECKNLTDEKLYDNYSLQKAGRAFYAKVRYYFNKY